ncbi:hypothetical protein BKA80DRAFT_94604 [Phyllosticta citrichinensis]
MERYISGIDIQALSRQFSILSSRTDPTTANGSKLQKTHFAVEAHNKSPGKLHNSTQARLRQKPLRACMHARHDGAPADRYPRSTGRAHRLAASERSERRGPWTHTRLPTSLARPLQHETRGLRHWAIFAAPRTLAAMAPAVVGAIDGAG